MMNIIQKRGRKLSYMGDRKDSLFGRLITAVVEDEKEKAKNKEPDWFMNQKKGMWYMLMNKIDSMYEEEERQKAEAEISAEKRAENSAEKNTESPAEEKTEGL